MEIKNKKIHFIAIGGAGMSALAKYCIEAGAQVSGSDISESKYTRLLENIGAEVHIGHDAALIKKDMIIAASTAVKSDNPEILRASELGIKVLHRSDILKMISDTFSSRNDAWFIGFSGTHGKTTTSGLASFLLEKAGFNPSFVIGGIIPGIAANGKYADGRYFIAELDESDGTIEKYASDISVINNMQEDHLDCYKNGFADIAETFNRYLSKKKNQKVIINIDDKGNREFMRLYPDYNYITFSLNSLDADYSAQNIKLSGFSSAFDIYKRSSLLSAGIHLNILGIHNIYNALAVSVALAESGIDINKIKQYYPLFTGMARRFQKTAEFNGITVFDDYAHHPAEIKAVLNAAKAALRGADSSSSAGGAGDGAASETNITNTVLPDLPRQLSESRTKITAVFQPHRYTRLQSFWEDFKNAFDCADEVFVLDVYPAGEKPIPNITSENFVKSINKNNVKYIKGSIEQAARSLFPMLKPNSLVITLGAGSITNLGGSLLNAAVQNKTA